MEKKLIIGESATSYNTFGFKSINKLTDTKTYFHRGKIELLVIQ